MIYSSSSEKPNLVQRLGCLSLSQYFRKQNLKKCRNNSMKRNFRSLTSLIDSFVPEKFKGLDNFSEWSEDLRRSRMVIALCLVGAPLALTMFTIRYMEEQNRSHTVFLLLISSVFIALGPVYIKRTGRHRTVATILLIMCVVILPIRILSTGGIVSTVCLWLAITPIIACMLVSVRMSAITAIITVFEYFVISQSQLFGFAITPYPTSDHMHFTVLSTLVVTITLFQMTYEPQRLKQKKQLLEQTRSIEESRAKLSELNRIIGAMVSSLDEGFLVFDKNGQSLPIHSKASLTHFRLPTNHFSLGDVLKPLDMDPGILSDCLEMLFSGKFPFETISELFPHRIINDEARIIGLRYFSMGQNGPENLVVVSKDITEEVQAQEQSKADQMKAMFLLKLARSSQMHQVWLEDLRDLMTVTALNFTNLSKLATVKQDLHSLKGLFSFLSLDILAQRIHDLETELSSKLEFSPYLLESLRDQFLLLREDFEALLKEFRILIPNSKLPARRSVQIDPQFLQHWFGKPSITDAAWRDFQDAFCQNLLCEPIYDLIGHFENYTTQLATTQSKRIAPFRWIGKDLRVAPHYYRPVLTKLIHVFRNIVDHGIEDVKMRTAVGKDPSATIEVKTEMDFKNQKVIIEITDDGRGIVIEDVRKRALEIRIPNVADMSEERLLRLVLDNGFSTKEKPTELSGRGVGLAALHSAVLDLGGNIELESIQGLGMKIRILVPWFEPIKILQKTSKTAI